MNPIEIGWSNSHLAFKEVHVRPDASSLRQYHQGAIVQGMGLAQLPEPMLEAQPVRLLPTTTFGFLRLPQLHASGHLNRRPEPYAPTQPWPIRLAQVRPFR